MMLLTRIYAVIFSRKTNIGLVTVKNILVGCSIHNRYTYMYVVFYLLRYAHLQ